jgi:methyl-galactoside transport system substrate-binding protein
MMGSLFRVQGGVPNIELVLCNNDYMALGVISALEAKGYNTKGSREQGAYIPVFGVDALATAMDAIKNGKMQGTVKQDGDAMAKAIVQIAANIMDGKDFLAGTEYKFEEGVRKLRIAYSPVNAE